jgi:hypothetical protein
LGGIWAEYWTQNNTSKQYKNIDQFSLTRTDYGATWNELYSGALNDAQYVVNRARENQDWNYYLMGTVIKAYTYQVMVDLYDEVPYTEAFQGVTNLQPKFDDGYTVYKGLLAELDTALAKNFSASTNTAGGTSDVVFPSPDANWNITNWVKFANTLKLKLYLRMSYAKPAEAEAGVKKMYASGAQFLDVDASVKVFQDAPDKSNPLYEYNFRKLNTDANLKASMTFLSFLQANSDPRIPSYYQASTGSNPATYTALHQGDFNAPSNTANNSVSKAKVGATDPVDLISLAESNFLQAEALERYFGGVGAKAKYDAGVTAAFSRLGYSAAPFIAAGGKYAYPTAGNLEQKVEAIIVQKWASMANAHALEAFFERNRTGYPRTSPVYSTSPSYVPGQFVYPLNGVTNGLFPKRLLFPDEERSKNSNTPDEKKITDKIWWDVR